MSLKIIAVVNGKTASEEYVRIQAQADTNAQGYAVVDRTFDQDGTLSNEFRHIYVFHKFDVKKFDWVRLHTGPGTYSTAQNKEKTVTTHHVYWGAKECVWNNNGGDKASLIRYTIVNIVDVPAVK